MRKNTEGTNIGDKKVEMQTQKLQEDFFKLHNTEDPQIDYSKGIDNYIAVHIKKTERRPIVLV